MLEALAHWIQSKVRELDSMVPAAQAAFGQYADSLRNSQQRLEQASYSNRQEALSEFVFTVTLELLGPEAGVLCSVIAGCLAWEDQCDPLTISGFPSMFLALMVRRLEEVQAKLAKVVMELYRDLGLMPVDECKSQMMMFFQFYTVQTASGTLEVYESCVDEVFADSPFRVHLIDSYGCLMKLLSHIEQLYERFIAGGSQLVVAVDFEGVKLSRDGPLCLAQMVLNDESKLVYVVDVHRLGRRAFSITTPKGMSLQNVLEADDIRKVWFDPRNDIDALFHQFGIMPQGIFDLQLAEVAERRSRGLNVHYVQGLFKCLTQCSQLLQEQKVFAERINSLGKRLFEPLNGGDYEIFRRRPLNPVILVYAAHDTRYMLLLHDLYVQAIGDQWVQRVLAGGAVRALWCMEPVYTMPGSEAPHF